MDIRQFAENKPGDLIPIDGIQGASHAFLPALLPPDWSWPVELWPLLRDARVELAKLDGIGRYLPNPGLMLRPLESREAQRSSQLEGTYATPQELLLFELDPVFPESAGDPANAVREVANYSKALRGGLNMLREGMPFTQWFVRELHSQLLDGVRGSDSNPGMFRNKQVQIGRPPRFVPPPAFYLPERMDNFEEIARRNERLYDPLVDAFIMHYQFEAIHPFGDGNGRVGRLLLALMITRWCELSDQWLYMSEFFDEHKEEYLERLLKVSTQNDWSGWIRFCLEGVIKQAKGTVERCTSLVELSAAYADRVRLLGGSWRLQAIVNHLFTLPVVQARLLATDHDVSYPTASADIRKLVSVGILEEVPDVPVKTYFAPEITNIIYGQ